MIELPTIYLSNWSSHKTPGHHGPGRKYTIMARPRKWERGEGGVFEFIPDADHLAAVQGLSISIDEYRRRYLMRIARVGTWRLKPTYLRSDGGMAVQSGDTLCCACSRAKAAAGECHRVWAAELLKEAGWHVVLDGKPLTEEEP